MAFWVIRMAVVKFRCFICGMLWPACVFECHVVVEHHDFASWQRNRSSAEQSILPTLKMWSNFLGGRFNTLSDGRDSVQVLGLRCHFIAQSLRQEENPVERPASRLWKGGGSESQEELWFQQPPQNAQSHRREGEHAHPLPGHPTCNHCGRFSPPIAKRMHTLYITSVRCS